MAISDRTLPLLLDIAMLVGTTPLEAQQIAGGRVASSAAGQAGQRQTREQPVAGIEPMARVDSRVQNRIQSRLRTRIDRFYDPRSSAASSFEAAADSSRGAGRPRRR